MDNTHAAIEILKRALKLNGYTYADVARHLELSEVSVKKMFSTCHFTLKRIDRICQMIGMDFMDLVRMFDESRQQLSTLSLTQEQHLMGDRRLFLVAICARNHWSFDEILNSFRFSKSELIAYLNQLERLQLLELHPGNRIRLRVAEDFRWLPRGPIETFFEHRLLGEFLGSDFSNARDMRLYLHGPLTQAARERLMQRLNVMAHEFTELMKESAVKPLSERHNVGLLLATREWEPQFVTMQRRDRD